MISILPEHAPPSHDTTTYKLIVADDVVAEFTSDEALLTLNAMADDFWNDMTELKALGPLIGDIDMATIEMVMVLMYVTESDGKTENSRYTELFRKLIKQKYYWTFL
jgi:hypothetical protein